MFGDLCEEKANRSFVHLTSGSITGKAETFLLWQRLCTGNKDQLLPRDWSALEGFVRGVGEKREEDNKLQVENILYLLFWVKGELKLPAEGRSIWHLRVVRHFRFRKQCCAEILYIRECGSHKQETIATSSYSLLVFVFATVSLLLCVLCEVLALAGSLFAEIWSVFPV